jgi:hypothetical protein
MSARPEGDPALLRERRREGRVVSLTQKCILEIMAAPGNLAW